MKINRTFASFRILSFTTFSIPAYPFMSIFILKFDQPQSFEKKP
jgi:hypothetical protein